MDNKGEAEKSVEWDPGGGGVVTEEEKLMGEEVDGLGERQDEEEDEVE